jgi:RNA polymerase sigma factor (sigma-70 family)
MTADSTTSESREQLGAMRRTSSMVGVVDDDANVRRAVARALRSDGYAVETFGSARELLARGLEREAACIVLDLRLPEIDGLELQARLGATDHEPGIVFLSGRADVSSAMAAMRAGAVDFLQKPLDVGVLLAAVRRAVERSTSARHARDERDELSARLHCLTHREREVMDLVVDGLPNKHIADRLGTSEKTIKVHRARVMTKMEAPSLADLVRMSLKLAVPPR